MGSGEIKSNISKKMESLTKELEIYQNMQPKRELKLI